MPGPGGGGRSGGFGGGSRGGGFGSGGRSGGFGGGHRPGGFYRPPFRHHYHRPFFFGFRPPFFGYGYGGGCLGGMLGIFLAPIIIILVIISLITSIFGAVGRSITNVASGGQNVYKESVMQEYADEQYRVVFQDSSGYEDNILIVFLVNEECDGYYTIAWVGDNIVSDINDMFGNQYTEFGREVLQNIPDYYKNSLSRSLASVVEDMTDNVIGLRLDSSFIKNTSSPGSYKSEVFNNSNLPINEETVNTALLEFTEKTDIPIAIVVDDIDDVFTKSIATQDIITVIIALAIGGFAIYLIVKSFKNQENNNKRYTNNDNFNGDNYYTG